MTQRQATHQRQSKRILLAAQEVQASLDGDTVLLEASVSSLLNAAERARLTRIAAPVLDDASATAPHAAVETLSTALLNLKTANILLASGIATGEAGAVSDRMALSQAIGQFDADPPEETHVAFEGQATVASANLDEATATFSTRSGLVLGEVVDGTGKLFTESFKHLTKIKPDEVIQAFDGLGQVGAVLRAAGRLLQQGVEKLRSALDALIDFVGRDAFDRVKAALQELWTKARASVLGGAVIETALGVPAVRTATDALLVSPGLVPGLLDGGSAKLYAVSTEYASRLRLLHGFAAGLGVAGATLAFVAGVAPYLPLLLAGGYLAVAAIGLLIGMDFVGSRRILGWTAGVQGVVKAASAGLPA